MRLCFLIFLAVLGICRQGFAQTAAPPPVPARVADLPAVVVSGVQPGPGLWKVSRGDHVLWILGTLSPLPRDMQWRSQEVEQVMAASQQVLREPRVKVKVDVGLVGKLFLLPAAYSARKNPDGRTLQQVLPPPVYARWLRLKQEYLGNDRGIERWRPLFASQELYQKALKANGLGRSGDVAARIDALARRDGVPEASPDYTVRIQHPHDALKAFRQAAPHDITCFIRTLESVEHDMPAMAARANAWATNDLQALRDLPNSDRRDACVAALTDAGFAQTLGLDDVPAKLRDVWLGAARKALAANAQTLALLPMDELLKPDGYLAALRAAGFQVESPQDQDDDVPPGAGPQGIR